MSRYKIVKGSESAHCCFDYTIVDSDTISMTYRDGSVDYKTMCECFDLEEAQVILDALNRVNDNAEN